MINRVEKHNTNTKYKYTYKNAILFSFYLLPNTYIFLFQKFFHNLYLISPSWSPGLPSLPRSPPCVLVYLCANVGLGVLPAALPAPFSATLSPALLVYLCMNVGPQGLLVIRLPAPFVPHSASLGPAMATQVLSAPAARLCPSYRSG